MKSFNNIAKLVKIKRLGKWKLSQKSLSAKLGYKNAQFISNVERAKCSIPLHNLPTLCDALGISETDVIDALLQDYKDTIRMSLLEGDTNPNA